MRGTRGPAGRPLAVSPCFLLSSRPPDSGDPQFSFCPAGRSGPGQSRDPSLARERAPRSPELCLPVSPLLRLQNAALRRPLRSPAAASAGPCSALSAGRVALSRGAQTWRRTQRSWESGSGVAAPEPEGRERGGRREGEGRSEGWAPGRLQRCITRAPSSLPFLLCPSRRRPLPRSAPHAPPGRLEGPPVSGWSAAPAPPRLGWGLPTPTLPCSFSISVSRRRPLSTPVPRGARGPLQTPPSTSYPGLPKKLPRFFVPDPGHGGLGRGEWAPRA